MLPMQPVQRMLQVIASELAPVPTFASH